MFELSHRSSTSVPPAIHGERVRTIRTALKLAQPENSRIAAATIGGHLEVITRDLGPESQVAQASDAVRDASLDFLVSLVSRREAAEARSAALKSVDQLEASLAA
jgi:hypothetical protein